MSIVIVPNLGYVPGNVQFLINWANRSKSDLSMEDFVNLCKMVARNST